MATRIFMRSVAINVKAEEAEPVTVWALLATHFACSLTSTSFLSVTWKGFCLTFKKNLCNCFGFSFLNVGRGWWVPSFLCSEQWLEQPLKPQEGRIWLPLEPMWFGLRCPEKCWEAGLLKKSKFHGPGRAKEVMAETTIVGMFQEIILESGTESQDKRGRLAGLNLLSPNEYSQGSSCPPNC